MLLAGRPWLTLERHLVDERLGRGRRARTRLRLAKETFKRSLDVHSSKIRPFSQRPKASDAGTPETPWTDEDHGFQFSLNERSAKCRHWHEITQEDDGHFGAG